MNPPLGLLYPPRNALTLELAPIPADLNPEGISYSYLDIMGPIGNQGTVIGDCWCWATSAVFEAFSKRRRDEPLVVSKRALWSLAKNAYESDLLTEDGGYPDDAMRAFEGIGYVIEADWPETNDDTDLRAIVPPDLIRKDFMAKGWADAGTSLDSVILAGHSHGPVAICFQVPNEWYGYTVTDSNGMLAQEVTPSGGYHAVCVVAHAAENELYAGAPAATLIRNSWGTEFGGGAKCPPGYAWAPDGALAKVLVTGNCVLVI